MRYHIPAGYTIYGGDQIVGRIAGQSGSRSRSAEWTVLSGPRMRPLAIHTTLLAATNWAIRHADEIMDTQD